MHSAEARNPEPETDELPVPVTDELPLPGRAVPPLKRPRRWWRGLTGAFAAGLLGLSLVVLGAQVLSLVTGSAGPGPLVLLGHFAAAAAVVLAQRYADKHTGPPAAAGGALVLLLTAITLWFYWWS